MIPKVKYLLHLPSCRQISTYDLSPARSVYAWGLARHGALGLVRPGHRKPTMMYYPRPIQHHFSDSHKVTNVECGFGFTLLSVKSTSGRPKLFGCGLNSDSQIGCHSVRQGHLLDLLLSPAPIETYVASDYEIEHLGAGRAHSAVAYGGKLVAAFGNNAYGQCGREIIEEESYVGNQTVNCMPFWENGQIDSVTCGQDHTLFLTQTGEVYFCGSLHGGEHISKPVKVLGDISGEKIVKVVGRTDCILALNSEGEVFGWGNSEYGQLTEPHHDQQYFSAPVYLKKLKHLGKIIDIAAGGSFCMVLTENHQVYVWGCGILGSQPNEVKTMYPQPVSSLFFGQNDFQPNTFVKSIACGVYSLACINNYEDLFMWGRNKYGCLGIGHTKDQFFPFKVCVGLPVKKVSCGVDHTMALCGEY